MPEELINVDDAVGHDVMAALELLISKGRRFGLRVQHDVIKTADGLWQIDSADVERLRGIQALLVAHLRVSDSREENT
jgi:hypothetical protein